MTDNIALNWYVLYMICINLFTFVLFVVDKKKAEKNLYRISEKTLLTLCAIGGALGGLFGMITANHKTKKLKFKLSVPLLCAAYVVLTLWFIKNFL